LKHSAVRNPNSHQFWRNRYLLSPGLGSGVGSKGIWKQRKLDLLLQICRRHQIGKVLDLGCGDLEVLADLPNLGRLDYVGVDFNPQVLENNRKRFPNLKFIETDLYNIPDLAPENPDLIICFDVLFHIEDDDTYNRVCDFIFNSGAKAVALTCSVGLEESNGTNLWYRDFAKRAEKLTFRYVRKLERPFREPFERIMSFDLVESTVPVQSTEVVYVCSPDRAHQLFVSLGTLMRSGSSFDRIVIFCVGRRPPNWQFADSRIIVEEVPTLFNDYFYANKVYLCSRSASRVVFLDTDTLILRPLDLLWEGRDADFLARVGTAYNGPDWAQEVWEATLHRVGASEVPMFNAGVLVFQNGSHRCIENAWSNYIAQYLAGEISSPYNDSRMPEQWGLALAVGSKKLSYSLLNCLDHGYAWSDELDFEFPVVFHTGNDLFFDYVFKVGIDATNVASFSLGDEYDRIIAAASQKMLEFLSGRVRGLERELVQIKSSRSFVAGTCLASVYRLAAALCRVNTVELSRARRAGARSLRKLLHRVLLGKQPRAKSRSFVSDSRGLRSG
jgi:Methyltransferase domain